MIPTTVTHCTKQGTALNLWQGTALNLWSTGLAKFRRARLARGTSSSIPVLMDFASSADRKLRVLSLNCW